MNNCNKILNSGKRVFTKKDLEKILDFKTKMALDKFLYREKNKWFLNNIFIEYILWKNMIFLNLHAK